MPQADHLAHSRGAVRTGRGFYLILGTTSLEKLMLSHKQLIGSSRKDRDFNYSSHMLPSLEGSNAIQRSRVKRDRHA